MVKIAEINDAKFQWNGVNRIYFWSTPVRPNSLCPGIYHSEANGLISISVDWTNRTTIADKNLWATAVWNSSDSPTDANCWNFYQWWNNYGFPHSWSITTDSTLVNAGSYWPGNYYSSSTFIIWGLWDSSDNADLRWDTTDTLVARQWPCASGFHVPTSDERTNILSLLTQINASVYHLKLPLAGFRGASSWNVLSVGSVRKYWTSTSLSWATKVAGTGTGVSNEYPGEGYPIRPFKNVAVVPDITWRFIYRVLPTNYHQ